jgi:2-polyprenyl-3-methyl-5-hydroxy-6-metoxy-1,4-benzoquinol methylase
MEQSEVPAWAVQAYEAWQSAIQATRELQQIYNEFLSRVDQFHAIPTLEESAPALEQIQRDLNQLYDLSDARSSAANLLMKSFLDRQHEFNASTVHLVNDMLDYLRKTTARLSQLMAVQIQYFLQITPWMDAKVNELRLEENHNVTHHVGELLQKIELIHQRLSWVETLAREAQSRQIVTQQMDVPPAAKEKDLRYHLFQQAFRASEPSIHEGMKRYLDLFASSPEPIVDIGCGRGEFLQLMKDAGKRAYGIDSSEYEVQRLKTAGFQVIAGDVLEHLEKLDSESIGGVFCSQVVEHLSPELVQRTLTMLSRVMKPGSPIVIETVNPLSVFGYHHVFFKDPTHIFPVHPETLIFMMRYSGFQEIKLQMITPVPEQQRLPLPKKENSSAELYDYLRTVTQQLNQLLYNSLEYYVVATRP